jgi:threonyl-tRNA synthetase
LAKVPVLLVVGKREAEEKKVSIRRLGSQEQTVADLAAAIASLKDEAVPPDLRSRDGSVSASKSVADAAAE